MKIKPIKVRIVGRMGDIYQIQFPNLKIPVTVNENLYNKMLHSSEYQFISSNTDIKQTYSE